MLKTIYLCMRVKQIDIHIDTKASISKKIIKTQMLDSLFPPTTAHQTWLCFLKRVRRQHEGHDPVCHNVLCVYLCNCTSSSQDRSHLFSWIVSESTQPVRSGRVARGKRSHPRPCTSTWPLPLADLLQTYKSQSICVFNFSVLHILHISCHCFW